MTPLQQQYSKQYGPGNYVPNVFIQYWGMRVMAYLAVLVLAIAVWGLWAIWRKTLATSRVFLWVAVWGAVLPFLMNTAGWLLTESGRQPWIVQGIMLTKNGISPTRQHHLAVDQPDRLHRAVRHPGHRRPDLMLRYSRKQLPAPARRGRPTRPCPPSSTRGHDESRPVLVHRHRDLVDRVLHPGGVRLRRRHAAQRWSAGTRPAAGRRSTRSGRCGTATRSG